ncbi:hypothetical protein Vretimale_19430 [Volvox reticuliferus]|uniref:Uncharacterized protein n=1 Tax=Volvox reticuliferus TaxID=1737510 RepID=A0A8J4GZA7_9CHLO|nr:hypothetical protein Vretifemale_20203 [Volvox reticuliferus]GIM16845.1 hypothetical protein Vretimale_19430 [Volvox reticuliferus]
MCLRDKQPNALSQDSAKPGVKGLKHVLLVSMAVLILCRSSASAQLGHTSSNWRSRQLLADISPSPAGSGTGGNSTLTPPLSQSSPPSPPLPLPPSPPLPVSPPPPGKITDKFKHLEEGKSPAEKGIAITIGVLMLVAILTCLVCCVFRRGGQWRVPGLQWLKTKFGPKDRYSRYVDNRDDGF